jgi:hypothetical protein
LPIDL